MARIKVDLTGNLYEQLDSFTKSVEQTTAKVSELNDKVNKMFTGSSNTKTQEVFNTKNLESSRDIIKAIENNRKTLTTGKSPELISSKNLNEIQSVVTQVSKTLKAVEGTKLFPNLSSEIKQIDASVKKFSTLRAIPYNQRERIPFVNPVVLPPRIQGHRQNAAYKNALGGAANLRMGMLDFAGNLSAAANNTILQDYLKDVKKAAPQVVSQLTLMTKQRDALQNLYQSNVIKMPLTNKHGDKGRIYSYAEQRAGIPSDAKLGFIDRLSLGAGVVASKVNNIKDLINLTREVLTTLKNQRHFDKNYKNWEDTKVSPASRSQEVADRLVSEAKAKTRFQENLFPKTPLLLPAPQNRLSNNQLIAINSGNFRNASLMQTPFGDTFKNNYRNVLNNPALNHKKAVMDAFSRGMPSSALQDPLLDEYLDSLHEYLYGDKFKKEYDEAMKKSIEDAKKHPNLDPLIEKQGEKAGESFQEGFEKGKKKKQKQQDNSGTGSGKGGRSPRMKVNGQIFTEEQYRDPVLGPVIQHSIEHNGYNRMSKTAMMNALRKQREEPLNNAKKAMAIASKYYSLAGMGSMPTENFAEAFEQKLLQNLHNGLMGRLDLGRIFGDALINRRRSKAFAGVFDQYALNTKELFHTEAFKKFLKDETMSEPLVRNQFGRVKLLSKRDAYSRLMSDPEKQKAMLASLASSPTDSAIVMGGLAQNKGAMKAMQAAGIGAALPIVAGAVAVKKLADAVGNLSKESLQAYEKIQTLQTQLGVVFGSDVESNAMFQQIAAFAKRSPVGVETQTEQAVLLKQSGVYAADLMDTMKRLTDLASGNNQRMKSLSEVYARVMSSTTVTARDMRQLANAGVPSYAALADATGIERGQIRSKLQSGKITSEDFQKMIQNLTNQGGMFYNATERGARTLAARRQNLSDAKQLERAALGEWLTKLGGNTTQNSWYGNYLSFMEKFYDMVETEFHIANSDKREEAYKSAVKDYERMKKEGASDETLAKKEAEINALYGESLAAGADKYDILKNLAGRDFTESEVRQLRNDIIMSTAPSDEGTVVSYNRSALGGMSERIFLRATKDIENMFTGRNQKLLSGITQQGYKNLDSAINSSTGGQMALANARKAWEAGELGKYAQTVKDEIKANEWRAKYAEFESKTYDKQNKTHDLSRLNATELERMSQFIYSDTDTIKFGLQDLLGADKNLKEGAKDELSALGENYTVLLKAIENSDSEHLEETAEQIKTILEILNGDWDKDAEGLGKSLASQVVALSDIANKEQKAAEEALKALPSNATEAERKAAEKRLAEANANVTNAQNATQKAVISTEDVNKFNARTQAASWAQVLSKMTGIEARNIYGSAIDGIAGLGGARTMSLYRDNISQRQMFSSVGKAILAQGGSLKELSSILTRNYKGTDSRGRGLFDWRSAGGAIERLALNGNSDTQQALINAYQNQIDALDELTVGSVATADTWENLTDTAKYLGTAFTLTADTMADGSVRFTEATIRAANEMREELSAKKLRAQIENVFSSRMEKLGEETRNNRLKNLAIRGELPGTSGLSVEKAEQFADAYVDLINATKGKSGDILTHLNQSKNLDEVAALFSRVTGENYTVKTGANTTSAQGTTEDLERIWTDMSFSEALKAAQKNLPDTASVDEVNEAIKSYLGQLPNTFKAIYNENGFITGGTYTKNVTSDKATLQENGKDITKDNLEKIIDDIQERVNKGGLTQEIKNLIDVLSVLVPDLAEKLQTLKEGVDNNTNSTESLERTREIGGVRDRVRGLLRERGYYGVEAQNAEQNKPFSQMSSTNPLNNSLWNSSVEEEWLAQMGLPTTARYKEARKRLAEIMPKDDNYYTEIGAFLSSKMSVKELLNPLENLGFQNRILEYNARNGTDYSEDSLSDMARGIKNKDGSIDTKKTSEFLAIMKDIGYSEDAIVNKFIDWSNVVTMLNSEMQTLGSTMKSALKDFTSGAILNTSKKFGEDMYQVWVYEKDQQKAMEGIKKSLAAEGAQLLDTISKQAVDTGLKIAANGAVQGNLGLVAGGLALAAAGGVGSFASGLLSAYSSDSESDKTDDSIEKLQNLKESLADLLKQARDDAKYYEETLRSKKALAVTSDMSTTKVNDMILTPQGKFSTAPDDYIMAMKDPASLRGSGSPSVNVQIVNQSGTQLNVQRTVQTQRSDGGLDIKMIVNGVVKQAMASGEYDDAMMAMQMNNRGRSTYA